ncbi:MAG: Preprotein translocase SecE subunit [Erysipelotrichaceae bacterium]|nr:MAG: Preprotein translocase SecE [Erysipelotrichaceae bacterium]TXT19320.1 MAG: Preprotein translocase SecE subunit [Erysipelotrichaceae bacterium]
MLKWFSLTGIFTEIKRIRWPKGSELGRNITVVLIFTVAFGIFFVFTEFAITFILKWIGIVA